MSEKKKKCKELRVGVTVRNNLILSKMEEMGIESASELSRKVGISASSLGRFMNMNSSPLSADMKWKDSAIKLADFFGSLPEDIFSDDHIGKMVDINRAEAEINFTEVRHLFSAEKAEVSSPEDIVFEKEQIALVSKTIETLNSQEKHVLRRRFGFDDGGEPTLEEVGKDIGVTRERVRQIEVRAIRKLRHPSRSRTLNKLRGR